MPRDENERYGNQYTHDDPADGLTSFPPSVQNKLARAQELLRQDRPSDALAAFHMAGSELARSSPELFALLVAGSFGCRRITFKTKDTQETRSRTDRFAFGVRYGHDDTATYVERKSKRRIILD